MITQRVLDSSNHLVFIASLSFLTLGCDLSGALPNSMDYYAMVSGPCSYTPDESKASIPSPPTTLTVECAEALEQTIPFSDTFKDAPPRLKEHVMEAFQALIGYPIALDFPNAVFGTQPLTGMAFPESTFAVFNSEENPNRAAFNYLMNRINEVRYDAPPKGNEVAAASYVNGLLRIYDGFYKSAEPQSPGRLSFIRAGFLLHEARHFEGDSKKHVECSRGAVIDTRSCDDDLSEAYGFTIHYYRALLFGSGQALRANGRPILQDRDIYVLGQVNCSYLNNLINNPYPELESLLETTGACSYIDAQWVIEHEGLQIP